VPRGPLERIDVPRDAITPRGPSVDGTPAAWWRRATGRLLDDLVVLTVLFMLVVIRVFWFVPGLVDDAHPDPWGRALVPQVMFVILSAVLQLTFLRWSLGQTPGRDRLQVRVVRRLPPGEDPFGPGSEIGVGRALARWAVPGLAILAPQVWPGIAFALLCGLPALVGPRRSLPDLIAGTRVVRFDRSAHEVAVRGHDGKLRRRPMPRLGGRLDRL
jgi:uncharacterized RDD family membrane protein YckC